MAAGGEISPGLAAELRRLAERALEPATLPDGLATLRRATSLFRDAAVRETATESLFQDLLQILKKVSHEIEATCQDASTLAHLDSQLQLLSECFRCLRNACVQCVNNQNVMRSLGLIDASIHVIQLLQKLENDLESLLIDLRSSNRQIKDASARLRLPSAVAFRCSLQFLGNIATGNRDSQNSIWKVAFPSLFLNCLNHQDEKIVNYCSMVLFTCLNPERTKQLQEHHSLKIALSVLQASRRCPELEWMTLIVTNHLLKCPELVEALYAKLSDPERTSLLELILSEMKENNVLIGEEMATFLAVSFEEKCQSVLRLLSDTNEDKEALVAARLLDILCEATSSPGERRPLQACPGLLEVALGLLKLVHLAGKQSTNIFTVTYSIGQEEISHPAVGFKSHLIRLIGNLCYRNKGNQEKVYELNGIPLILDNCSIDNNNPFISQWAVYAIRNLTEENERNQEFIARMEQQGPADNPTLESLGLKIESRDQKQSCVSTGFTPNALKLFVTLGPAPKEATIPNANCLDTSECPECARQAKLPSSTLQHLEDLKLPSGVAEQVLALRRALFRLFPCSHSGLLNSPLPLPRFYE
ncbi:ataxin-10 [Crotalus adamanteus]|uniref:Ataxin-10 n=1 Tax=Crotalus adamanteus TaxID=8729 RepID=A0AAW1BB44_CROAD